MRPTVGLTLQPEVAFLDRLDPLIRAGVDHLEVAPETLWRRGADGRPEPNGFHARLVRLVAETGLSVVAHGVGLSLGSASPRDEGRRRAWLDRIRRDHEVFDFAWYTDHLATTALAGRWMQLPLAIPPVPAWARLVRRHLAQLREIVPDVGFENTVCYGTLGAPLEEAALIAAVLEEPGTHLLLDVHNLWTMSQNLGFDPREWLARVDLARVIEVHVSGGSESDPAWLSSGRTLRLDSHDAAVPEPVWRLLEEALPRCPNVRGLTLERMEGTVGPEDVEVLTNEVARLRRVLHGASGRPCGAPSAPVASCLAPDVEDPERLESVLAEALLSRSPWPALRAARKAVDLPPGLARALDALDRTGLEIAALLVARLRFERLLQTSREAARAFDEDPAAFTAAFRRAHHAEPPTDPWGFGGRRPGR